jgi:hypothetical protein
MFCGGGRSDDGRKLIVLFSFQVPGISSGATNLMVVVGGSENK